MMPITPDEVAGRKASALPTAAVEAFNEQIVESARNGHASFTQAEVVARMIQKGIDREDIFKRGWLDVEDAYESAGWDVEYDKPGFNESYEPRFTFTRKAKR